MEGKIKFVKEDRGFGFIEEDGGKDYFFHISDFADKEDFKKLAQGVRVEFEKGIARDGQEKAAHVKLI